MLAFHNIFIVVPPVHDDEYREVEGTQRVKSAIKIMSSRDRQKIE